MLNRLIDSVERKGQEKAGGYGIGGSVRHLQRFLPGSDAAESLSGRFSEDRRDSAVRGRLVLQMGSALKLFLIRTKMKSWGLSAWMSMVTAEYNNALVGAVSAFAAANSDITISIGDLHAIWDAQLSMPERYSLKNVTDESPNAAQTNKEIDYTSKHYFFWDFVTQ